MISARILLLWFNVNWFSYYKSSACSSTWNKINVTIGKNNLFVHTWPLIERRWNATVSFASLHQTLLLKDKSFWSQQDCKEIIDWEDLFSTLRHRAGRERQEILLLKSILSDRVSQRIRSSAWASIHQGWMNMNINREMSCTWAHTQHNRWKVYNTQEGVEYKNYSLMRWM